MLLTGPLGLRLRDYSQAVDVGAIKGVKSVEAIRILVWILSFLAFGYATEEFVRSLSAPTCTHCTALTLEIQGGDSGAPRLLPGRGTHR